jgi:hypothetical protein
MRTEIKKLHHKLKTTIVYVTHDQIEAMTLSTRIAVMNKGYVQQLGTPKEIYDTPANITFLRAYAPSITITRNAPGSPPAFSGCPQDVKRVACESQTGYNNVPCSYSGGCNGTCECPQPPVEDCSNPLNQCFWEDFGSVFSVDGLNVVADGLEGIIKGGVGFAGDVLGEGVGAVFSGLGVNPQLLVYGAVGLGVILIIK